jgi:uncharacterized membrane protein
LATVVGIVGVVVIQEAGWLLLLLGVVIGLLVLAAAWHPLAGIVPTAVLLVLYGPLYSGVDMPAWIPTRLERLILESGSPEPPVIVGVLLSATVVPLVARTVARAWEHPRALRLTRRSVLSLPLEAGFVRHKRKRV